MTTTFTTSESPKFQSRVDKQRPRGTISMTRFAVIHCVSHSVMKRCVLAGIAGEHIEVTEVTLRQHVHRYLTPEQQRKALEFWVRHGVLYQ